MAAPLPTLNTKWLKMSHLLVNEWQGTPHGRPSSSLLGLGCVWDLGQAQKVKHAAKRIRSRRGLKQLKLFLCYGALHLVHNLSTWAICKRTIL